MSSDYPRNPTMQSSVSGRLEGSGVAPPAGVPLGRSPAVEVDVTEAILHDHVHWGPIVAGVVSAFAVLLFLTVLGIALGISTLGGDDAVTWGTAAGIWGGLSLLVAFFVGGWIAARSASTFAEGEGVLNGFIAGAATLLLLLWLTTTAVTGVLGFFATAIAGLANIAVENSGAGAWGTTIAIVLAIAAAMIGGMVGQNQQFAFPGARAVIARR